MVFAEFSHAIGNWLENPYVCYVMKSTIGWESNCKKAPILWEKYEYQFPRSSPYDGFCCIFLYHGKFMWEPIHFPYDQVYHRMGISWEIGTHTMEKVWLPISQVFSTWWGLLHFLVLWEIDGKALHRPYDKIYHAMGIGLEKSTHTIGKVWLPIS